MAILLRPALQGHFVSFSLGDGPLPVRLMSSKEESTEGSSFGRGSDCQVKSMIDCKKYLKKRKRQRQQRQI